MRDKVTLGIIAALATAGTQELNIRRLLVHADEDSLLNVGLRLAIRAEL